MQLSINDINNLQAENAELKALSEELGKIIECKNGTIATLAKTRDELKAENERLKEENVKLLFDKGTLIEFCNKLTQIIDKKKESENKLLQTLQEIKKICKMDCGDCEFNQDCDCNYQECEESKLDDILDLITKAEEE